MDPVRLAIVGSRYFPYPWMVEQYLRRKSFDELVSGGAKGVDTWAAIYAKRQSRDFKVFPADWEAHGKMAGFLRNHDIVDYATDVVAFWYGESRGTAHTIKLAREAGKLREVIHVY